MPNPPPDSEHSNNDHVLPNDIAALIIDETYTLPRSIWQEVLHEVRKTVKTMSHPLSHGTSRCFFNSILQHGLGSAEHQPPFARHRGSSALSTLQNEEGWLGSYGFATWDDTQYLAVDSRSVLGHGIVHRFCDVAEFLKGAWFGKRWLSRIRMQQIVNRYLNERAARDREDALFLIYEGGNDISYTCTNRVVRIEVRTADILPKEKLRYAFVPARKHNVTQAQLLLNNASHVKVLPIELFELEAIFEERRIRR